MRDVRDHTQRGVDRQVWPGTACPASGDFCLPTVLDLLDVCEHCTPLLSLLFHPTAALHFEPRQRTRGGDRHGHPEDQRVLQAQNDAAVDRRKSRTPACYKRLAIASRARHTRPVPCAFRHGGVAAEFSDDADREQFTTQPARDYVGLIEASQRMVVAVRTSPTGDGYWLVMADGAVYGRGDAPDFDQVHTNGAPVLSATSRIDTAPALRT